MENQNTGQQVLILVIIAGSIYGMYLLRNIYCWYIKVNEQIELQKETNQLLKDLINKIK